MTRDEKIARARALRDSGWSYQRIGEHFGVGHATVWKWLNREAVAEMVRQDNARRAAAKRAWENEHDRRPCPRCGALMGVGQHRRGGKVCRRCYESDHPGALEMLRCRVEEGLSNREIAARLGVAPSSVAGRLSELRRSGYDVPRDPYHASRREYLRNAA